MLAWLWGEYRVIEEDHRLMRFENARIGNLKAEQVAPDVLLLTQLREYIRFTRTELHEGMSSSELETMRKVAHRYSYTTSLFRYALALGINGQSAAAVEQLVILRALHGDKRYTESWGDLQGLQVQYPQLAAMKKP